VNGVAEYRAIKAEGTYEVRLRDSASCSMHYGITWREGRRFQILFR